MKSPNAKQIHDVRTAIRRLDATYLMLPKQNRSASTLSDYVLECKKFFMINSEIRDLDIIYEKLQKYPSNVQRNTLSETLKVTRDAKLEGAKTIARSLKRKDMSSIETKCMTCDQKLLLKNRIDNPRRFQVIEI